MKILYIEKRVNRNSNSIAIAAELVARRHRGELGHRRGGGKRDEETEEEKAEKGDEKI